MASASCSSVGFCMGGQLSLYAATINDKVAACVNYYGIHPNVRPDYKKLTWPLMGFFGEYDEYVPASAVSMIDLTLTEMGKTHRFKTYDKTHHAFFNDGRPEVYNREAAEDSWSKMTAFFHKQLG